MNRLERQPPPLFWADKEKQYRDGSTEASKALHGWTKDNKSLAAWFHEVVRPAHDRSNCAYCDGPLNETSSETIDHFIPSHFDRDQGLCWPNLYPSCQKCNTGFKGKQWSCRLLRPDIDPVESLIAFDPNDGRLFPAPERDARTRARVRLTIRVFGLNAPDRCKARRRVWRVLQNANDNLDRETAESYVTEGPYRLVARLFFAR